MSHLFCFLLAMAFSPLSLMSAVSFMVPFCATLSSVCTFVPETPLLSSIHSQYVWSHYRFLALNWTKVQLGAEQADPKLLSLHISSPFSSHACHVPSAKTWRWMFSGFPGILKWPLILNAPILYHMRSLNIKCIIFFNECIVLKQSFE